MRYRFLPVMVCMIFLAGIILSGAVLASAASAPSLIEKIESSLKSDGSFNAQDVRQYVDSFRVELASYAFDIMRDKKKSAAADVLLSVVAEGSFDGVDIGRTVKLSAAAYIAVRRGSAPDVVEGIALYGFRKNISANKIEAWANGYNDCVKHGVPADMAEDLVYNAAEHDWDIKTFNTLKWGLVDAAKAGYDMEDFQAHLVGNYLKGKRGPGSVVGASLRYFRELPAGKRPDLPPYKGSFVPRYERREQDKTLLDVPPATDLPVDKGVVVKPSSPTPKAKSASPSISQKPVASQEKPVASPKTKSQAIKKAQVLGSNLLSRLEKNYRAFLGVPYVWGGETRRGTDCSGFTQSVFSKIGIRLPRVSRDQWRVGKGVSWDNLRKGDLVFFRTIGHRISHVGIFTDRHGMTFIHASSSKGVTFSKLSTRYYKARYAGARRVIPEGYASLAVELALAYVRR